MLMMDGGGCGNLVVLVVVVYRSHFSTAGESPTAIMAYTESSLVFQTKQIPLSTPLF
jgi:hypothetical protein